VAGFVASWVMNQFQAKLAESLQGAKNLMGHNQNKVELPKVVLESFSRSAAPTTLKIMQPSVPRTF
jgi:hypothetical protein